MQILSSQLFQKQLKEIFQPYVQSDPKGIKDFKLYLDTVILNMPSKAKKYKQSVYFDNENIRDIEHQGYTIPFFMDEKNGLYLILGIIQTNKTQDT